MEISTLYSLFLKYPSVCTDSRKAQAGSIFFALCGESFNGNLYAQTALDAGCAYAVVDDEALAENKGMILVPNVLTCLQELAQYHRRTLNIPVLAITGSNGKTTTKELVREVVAKKFEVVATVGNLNNHIGVPLTLLSAKASTEFLVVEMGANHPNDIAELCAIAEPNFGIVTNVGKAHLEGFGSLEGVMRAKSKLFEWLFDHDGLAFVNLDNELILSMLMHQKTSGYGVSDSADCSGVLLDSADGYLAAHVIVRAPNAPSAELLDIQTALVGGYNFENLLAACAVGSFFDVPPRAIKEAVEAYRPSNNRSQIEVTAKNRVIKDAYNANPSSMRLAIENFAKSSFANKVLILGEMREVGDFKAREHSEIMDLIASYEWYAVFLVGESYGQGSDRFVCFENTPALVGYLQTKPLEACTVLVKGSRGVKLELCYPEL